jgi:ankyrin repeat protein
LADLTLILASQPNVNELDASGLSALHYAARDDDGLELVRALLKANADVSVATASGVTAAHLAATLRSPNILQELVAAHRDAASCCTTSGDTPLHYAAGSPHGLAVVRFLVDDCATDLAAQGTSNRTALEVAKHHRHQAIEDFLFHPTVRALSKAPLPEQKRSLRQRQVAVVAAERKQEQYEPLKPRQDAAPAGSDTHRLRCGWLVC